ncbi:hypothetical protein WME99_25770 [Sorangium sp. So ce136]|uniref:hypothetical protein n=1 Tax=Sorangium sp. So ce136 TaxID=3133284 RepID=UPI003F06864C
MRESHHIKYHNHGGSSGVDTYKIEEESIEIAFKGGGTYLYAYQATGRQNVERMKFLARSGRGLNAFINTHVKNKYAKRLR